MYICGVKQHTKYYIIVSYMHILTAFSRVWSLGETKVVKKKENTNK